MTEPNELAVELEAPTPGEEDEGGGGGLFTVGLFVVMVVFTIGCMFFGWFQ